MNDRWANIDVVFRNGLKDYEVLPPPEVWDRIQPVIKTRHRPIVLVRAAALIAVLITMSFLAYRWSRETSNGNDGNVMTLNMETASPLISPYLFSPPAITRNEIKLPADSHASLTENIQDLPESSSVTGVTNPAVAFLQKTNSISPDIKLLLNTPHLATLKPSSDNTFKTEEFNYQYITLDEVVKDSNRWTIAAMAAPTFYSSFNSGNSELSNQLKASEQNLISYSGGVAFSYKVNKRLNIQSGLFYSSVGQELDGISSYSGFQKYDYTKGDRNFEVLTTSGIVYTNNTDVFLLANGPVDRIMTSYTNDVFDPRKASLQYINNTLHQNFSYLELPIVLRYKVIDKVIDFNLIGGISYNFLLDNSVYTTADGVKYPIGKTEGLKPITLSSSLGMGMEYNFSEKLSLNLEPIFRYYLNPYKETAGTNMHPYSFGIFSGVSYKF